jgi:hypothetical protein
MHHAAVSTDVAGYDDGDMEDSPVPAPNTGEAHGSRDEASYHRVIMMCIPASSVQVEALCIRSSIAFS